MKYLSVNHIYLLLTMFLLISCSEQFKIVKHQNSNSDYVTVNSSYIEAKVSSMADIYYYKIYLSPSYVLNKNEESYILNVKYLGISFFNLQQAWLEINGIKFPLNENNLPIQKQEGTSYLAEIHSFRINKETFKAMTFEDDSRIVLKSGQLIIDIYIEKDIKEKLLKFYNECKNILI